MLGLSVTNTPNFLTVNFYELLGLPQQFALDGGTLAQHWRDLQSQVHPDNFANASEADKRLAMQVATRVNEAYQTLKQPLKRAQYLCEQHGVALGLENNTAMPPAFLMQQMEWRESLSALAAADSASQEAALLALQNEVDQDWQGQLAVLAGQLDIDKNYTAAAQTIRQLLFVEKFAQDVATALEKIDA